ncbi:MAG: DUF1080 domain-containing protein [Sphingobacteriaceae bacterium]|nr:DUF1080 domain-containing protein [Sphingobacteriaceae bacterium]
MNLNHKYLSLLLLSCILLLSFSGPASLKSQGFVALYNGKDLAGWNIMCKTGGEEMARKIFSPEAKGIIHVYKNFPDGYQLNENKNDTHGMIFTQKKYSRYIFKFEYKWGSKRLNNFDMFQYDAGVYYHVNNQKIWPGGIEYQVRYDHVKSENHTGDIWNGGLKFKWFEGPGVTYLSPDKGGKERDNGRGEHKASPGVKYHALNGKWNKCEIIVMGDEYAIHKLNGKVVNMITRLNIKEGAIGLQSETAEIFYRNIMIKELDKSLPASNFL